MPPIRRRSRIQDTNVGAEAALLNGYSVQQLRNLCRQKKIASTGNKATLLNRLRGSGPRVTVSNADARGRLQETNEMFGSVPVLPQDHVVNTNVNDSTFSEGQLNTIRLLVEELVAAASREIAHEWTPRSGRRSGFTAKFLANSFTFQSHHASHRDCHATANSKSIGYMSTCGAISGYSCSIREGYTV